MGYRDYLGPGMRRVGEYLEHQCEGTATKGQTVFDVSAGVVMPVLCLVFDPVVFRNTLGYPLGNGINSGGFLGGFTAGAYVAVAIEVAALSAWVLLGTQREGAIAFLVGVLGVGAVLAFLIGVCLLPVTLLGLFVVIGLLGLAPFLTAFVFFRNAVRAFRTVKGSPRRDSVLIAIALGAVFAIAIPSVMQARVSRSLSESFEQVMHGNPRSAGGAVRELRRLRWCCGNWTDRLMWAYEKERDEKRRQYLAGVYREITGRDAQERLEYLRD